MFVRELLYFYLRQMKIIASEVFKSLKYLNLKFMNEIFEIKGISYDLRDSKNY